jgi:hypothetical protein
MRSRIVLRWSEFNGAEIPDRSQLLELCVLFIFSLIDGTDVKIVYRHYATLYFVFCVDSSESELGILDLIQV